MPAGFHTTIEPHQEVVGDVRANGVVVTQEMLDERKKKATENTGHFKYKPGHPNQTFSTWSVDEHRPGKGFDSGWSGNVWSVTPPCRAHRQL